MAGRGRSSHRESFTNGPSSSLPRATASLLFRRDRRDQLLQMLGFFEIVFSDGRRLNREVE